MGAKKQTKGRAAGDKKGKPPGGTCYPCPGGEDHLKRRSSSPPVPPSPWLPALPPRKQTETFGRAGAARVQPRGCKGRSPLHEITLGSPFPPGRALCERGSGGWGQKSKLKSGAAGNPKGKPPLWIPEWHGQPATSRASPPPGAPTAGRAGNGAAHLPTTVIISCGKCDIFPKIC